MPVVICHYYRHFTFYSYRSLLRTQMVSSSVKTTNHSEISIPRFLPIFELVRRINSQMRTSQLIRQIEFIKEIDKLKYIQRKTRLFNSNRNENDAEHSWHLAVMAIILSEHANVSIDVLKVVKMLLIHDIVEIDAGDTFIYDTQKSHDNTAEEQIAAERIFGLLPADQANELLAIWAEFEERQTDEAKFARAMDRLEPLLQNVSNNGGTWREFEVEFDQVYQKKQVIQHGSEAIWAYAEQLLNESVESGILKKTTV